MSKDFFWIYGKHAVMAALKNNKRVVEEILCSNQCYKEVISLFPEKASIVKLVEKGYIEKVLQSDVNGKKVHQGIAASIKIRQPSDIDSLQFTHQAHSFIVILDRIEDMQNIGAIIRSASAFSVDALLIEKRYEVLNSPIIFKTSAGTVEDVNIVSFGNLVAGIRKLKEMGYWVVGLKANASHNLTDLKKYDKIAVILGAEGDGMRRLTEENCDLCASIKMHSKCESLNVSVAAAIAMYELNKR